jgi:hypothetical protein
MKQTAVLSMIVHFQNFLCTQILNISFWQRVSINFALKYIAFVLSGKFSLSEKLYTKLEYRHFSDVFLAYFVWHLLIIADVGFSAQ